ncbi:lycopene beta cyclase [Skeletonema marinoi]|uniref:lycopene beta-cyclase n=1 Tax=Skeletonema marinoi TaxID=267567 RepID=A0AAD9DG70_9STRA|nr:lycopene beta cyclase [Skeletonema marinoi]
MLLNNAFATTVVALLTPSALAFAPTRQIASTTLNAQNSIISSPLIPTPVSARSTILSKRTALFAQAAADSVPAPTSNDSCDVLVLGSGPAARSIATLLASPSSNGSFDILLADTNYDRRWAPNYGVWQDEWQSILQLYSSFKQPLGASCVDRLWEVTDCFFGGSFDIPVESRMRLDRPYCRVDRDALRRQLSPKDEIEVKNDGDGNANYRVIRSNHISKATAVNIYSPAGSMVHDESGSTVLLQSKDGDVTQVRAKVIVDCTGHESRIVLKDDRVKSIPPGFQIAYGVLAKVDESSIPDSDYAGPYYKEAMTLFDYRTDHFPEGSNELSKAEKAPTFMYAMPLDGNRIFFEETSLVARPAVSFQECKERYLTRMEHLGITITEIEEEEFCYIPMGGPLPAADQRVVGFGGAAAMVHPSTGYHLCRAMMASGSVAEAIRKELANDKNFNPDRAAASAYNAIWSPTNIAQRNFAVFGGEFLMKQNVEGLRGFFDGFFKLPLELWGGFLAGWPGLPNNENHETWWARLKFGLSFVSKLPPLVALDMLVSIATYSITEGVPLPQSVTPLLGLPDGYEYKEKSATVGDVAAKSEAMKMIMESKVEEVVPVAFEQKEV